MKKIFLLSTILLAVFSLSAPLKAEAVYTPCTLEISKTVSDDTVVSGDEITFTLNFGNYGTEECTGDGVRIQDKLNSNFEFVSADTSTNVYPGYSKTIPLYDADTHTVNFNARTLSSFEEGWASITVRVKDMSCGVRELTNKGRITSRELSGATLHTATPSTWITSNTVTVTQTKECNPPVNLICEADPSSALVGEPVTWTAYATGGTGNFTYSWSGSDGLSGTSSSIVKTYNTIGGKNASVLVTSGTEKVTVECSMLINEVPVVETCPFQPAENRVIVDFTKRLRTDLTANDTFDGPISVSLNPGEYSIQLASFDGFHGRRNNTQIREQWYLELAQGNTVTNSGVIDDVPDPFLTNYSSIAQTVNSNLVITHPVTEVYARHAVTYGMVNDDGTANSLSPVCAAIDLVTVETPPVNAICEADPAKALKGEPVTWTAYATGGTGNFTYSWSGSDGLSGTSSSIMKSYSTSGIKTSTVTVKSGDKTVENECSVIISEPTPSLSGLCEADPASVLVNEPVTWSAFATGGNGGYTYSWSGDDSLSGTSSTLVKQYGTTGTKKGTITITSDGETVTRECTVEVIGGTGGSPFDAVCEVSDSSVGVGALVTFSANAVGGVGGYIYNWSGDGVNGKTTESVNTSYTTTGTKTATIEVTSGTESITKECKTIVTSGGGGCIGGCGGGGPTPPNVLLLKKFVPQEEVEDNFAFVYLSSIPYTGLGPTAKTMLVVLSAIILSGVIAYAMARKIARPTVSPNRSNQMMMQQDNIHPLLSSFGANSQNNTQQNHGNVPMDTEEHITATRPPSYGELPHHMKYENTTPPQRRIAEEQNKTVVNNDASHSDTYDVNALLSGIAVRDNGLVFSIIRTLRAEHVLFSEYMAHVVSSLDAVYRDRVEGTYANADPELVALYSQWSDVQLESLITQLLRAVNMTYNDAYTATQLSLVSALNS
ncbi:MAG: hypothetical protein WDZ88_01530 [Candidatus Paceibacterota bacterium]